MSNNQFVQTAFQFPSPDLPTGFYGVEPASVTQPDGSEPADEKGGL